MEEYKQLRQEFTKPSFRKYIKEQCGEICVNCGSDNNIEYHHIIPLINGGTNKISNIVALCQQCHYIAHQKSKPKEYKGGRPKAIEFKDAEPILHRYFNLEIGSKETKELLGLSNKNKSTWYRLTSEYKQKYNISYKFRNNIDIQSFHNERSCKYNSFYKYNSEAM